MGQKEAYMEHIELGGGDITISPDADESFVIKDVFVETCPPDGKVEFKVGRTTLGYRIVESNARNHLFYNYLQAYLKNFTDILRTMGVVVDIPVATGECFSVKGVSSNKACKIEYEIYDAGDIHKDAVNGSEAKEFYLINYGVITEEEYHDNSYCLVNKSLQPAELPAFPFGDGVPAKTEIDLLGIFGHPCRKPDGAGYIARTLRLKLIKDRKTLFTKQDDGFLFERADANCSAYEYGYDKSDIGFGTQQGQDMPFILPKPMTFKAGEELGVYVYYKKEEHAGGGGTALYGRERLGVIERVRRVE